MGVNPQEVPQTVREKEGGNEVGHHLINITMEEAELHELLKSNPVGKAMHIGPGDTGAHGLGGEGDDRDKKIRKRMIERGERAERR